jgi:hypothetical protein
MNIEFTKENVETCEELIKRYSLQKFYAISNGNTYNKTNFISYINNLLQENLDTQKNLTNQVFQYLNDKIPGVSLQTNTNQGNVKGDINKLSTYVQLQTFNNRWVAGSDLLTRTLFEDFLFMNTANADIGDQLQFFIEDVIKYLKMEKNMTISDLIGHILNEDRTTLFYATPSFINFNGVLDAENYDKPIDIDIPNSLFGTFRNVNYLDSRQKFIFLYVGKTSEHPALNDNRNVVYGDDSFDIRNQADCPVRIPQTPETNFYKTNKIVGFNVDFGIRNQNMFKKFNVAMGGGKQTAVTFKVNERLAGGSSGDKVAQETQSMYSYYKSLSYNIDVSGMGNVMIQPLMYFNLRHIPLFYGPYQILEVNHTINETTFETKFSGVRIPKYALPDVDSISTFIKKNYLEKYKSQILKENNENRYQADVETILDPSRQSNEPKTSPEDECNKLLNNAYKTLPYVNNKVTTTSIGELILKIKNKQPEKYVDGLILLLAMSRPTNLFDNKPINALEATTLTNDGIISCINNNIFLLSANNIYATNTALSKLTCVSFPEGAVPLFSFDDIDGGLETINGILGATAPLIEGIKNIAKTANPSLSDRDAYSLSTSILLFSYDSKYLFTGTRTAQDIFDFYIQKVTSGEVTVKYVTNLIALASICNDKF